MLSHQMADLALLSKVLDKADGDTFENLEGRITVQKKIYLLQAFGVDLGYTFEWNVFGPYCAELSEDCRTLEAYRDEISGLAEPLEFRREIDDRLERAPEIFKAPPELNLPDAAWLELVSSCHMLAKLTYPGLEVWQLAPDQRGDLEDDLVARKTYFEDLRGRFEPVWKVLIEHEGSSTETTNE